MRQRPRFDDFNVEGPSPPLSLLTLLLLTGNPFSWHKSGARQAVGFALLTGFTISAYTITDKVVHAYSLGRERVEELYRPSNEALGKTLRAYGYRDLPPWLRPAVAA